MWGVGASAPVRDREEGSVSVMDVDPQLKQRLDALELANAKRSARGQIKRDLTQGRVSIITLLVDPPAVLDTAEVRDFLRAIPGVGRKKAEWCLRSCGMSLTVRFGDLSLARRAELVRALRPSWDRAVA